MNANKIYAGQDPDMGYVLEVGVDVPLFHLATLKDKAYSYLTTLGPYTQPTTFYVKHRVRGGSIGIYNVRTIPINHLTGYLNQRIRDIGVKALRGQGDRWEGGKLEAFNEILNAINKGEI